MANTPRAEFVQWMKDRALAELEAEGPAQSFISLISDVDRWDGGELYCQDQVRLEEMCSMTLQEFKNAARKMCSNQISSSFINCSTLTACVRVIPAPAGTGFI